MTAYDEERLGTLLSALKPAPEAWVRAAQELPLVQRSLDEIVARAHDDEEYRRRVLADPEAALEEADVVAHSGTIEILEQRLTEEEEEQPEE
jgi:hypothetical protein